jgi:hypothetical protein
MVRLAPRSPVISVPEEVIVASVGYLVVNFGGGACDTFERTVHTPEGVFSEEALRLTLPLASVVHALDTCVVTALFCSPWLTMGRTAPFRD